MGVGQGEGGSKVIVGCARGEERASEVAWQTASRAGYPVDVTRDDMLDFA